MVDWIELRQLAIKRGWNWSVLDMWHSWFHFSHGRVPTLEEVETFMNPNKQEALEEAAE